MDILFLMTFLCGFIIIAYIVIRIIKRKSDKKIESKIQKISNENSFVAIDELRKILKQRPSDHKTREKLVEVLFNTKMYLPAIKESMLLIDASVSDPDISELKYTNKIGEAYFMLNNFNDSKKYFMFAKKIDDLDYTTNFYLGKIEYENANYDKALSFLNIAVKVKPESLEAQKMKGLLSFQSGLYRETVNAMMKVIESNPEDTDAYYYLGYSYFKLNRSDEAKKVLNSIVNVDKYKFDVQFILANICRKDNAFVQAIEIFENMIKTSGSVDEKVKGTKMIEAYYNLSECYFNIHNISKSLYNLEEAAKINPNYKDIQQKIELYTQLARNTLLEKYLIGSVNEFTNICKMFVKYYVKKSSAIQGNVKFISAGLNSKGEMEIRAELSSNKFVIVYYFVFFRSNTTIGEFVIRNIYNMLKDEKIDKGVCVTAGNFSETAVNFIESRMLEIVEKQKLSDILKDIGHLLNTAGGVE